MGGRGNKKTMPGCAKTEQPKRMQATASGPQKNCAGAMYRAANLVGQHESRARRGNALTTLVPRALVQIIHQYAGPA
jgi:hypothetical protein